MVFPFIVNWMLLLLPLLCVRVCRSLFAIIVINWTWKTHRLQKKERASKRDENESLFTKTFINLSSFLFRTHHVFYVTFLHTSHSLSLLHIIATMFSSSSKVDFHHRLQWSFKLKEFSFKCDLSRRRRRRRNWRKSRIIIIQYFKRGAMMIIIVVFRILNYAFTKRSFSTFNLKWIKKSWIWLLTRFPEQIWSLLETIIIVNRSRMKYKKSSTTAFQLNYLQLRALL